MTEKDMEKEEDRMFANFKQQTRVEQFSQAAKENRNVFKGVAAFLAVIVAMIAFAALIYGDACWAKSFPRKDYHLIAIFICSTLAVVLFAILAVISGKTYLTTVDEISSKTRAMYKAWVLDNTDFRHDTYAKLSTFIEYVAKELNGLFVTLSSIGIIASVTTVIAAIIAKNTQIALNNALGYFAALHLLIMLLIAVPIILSKIVDVGITALELASSNLSDESDLPGSLHSTSYFKTTFSDRLALLRMPPKETKSTKAKDNGGE